MKISTYKEGLARNNTVPKFSFNLMLYDFIYSLHTKPQKSKLNRGRNLTIIPIGDRNKNEITQIRFNEIAGTKNLILVS